MDLKYLIIWIFVLSKTFATFINIPGDVVFVGLFKIWKSEAGTCSSNIDVNSVMLAESVKWYINQLNKYGGLSFNIGKFNLLLVKLMSMFSVLSIKITIQSQLM